MKKNHFRFIRPKGHAQRHMPQTATPVLFSSSLKKRSQAAASNLASRGSFSSNNRPVNACTGQFVTHSVQFPHRLSMGEPVGARGASVSTVTHLTRGP